MLKFFREKQVAIIWTIVIFFSLTMFSGGLFFDFSFPSFKSDRKIDVRNEFAVIGEMPVNLQKYQNILIGTLNQIPSDQQKNIDPEQLEALYYFSFNKAVNYTILLNLAREKKIKITKQEIKVSLEKLILEKNLKDKTALKNKLKENGYEYKAFLKQLKNDILVEKLLKSIEQSIVINHIDLKNKYSKIKLNYILIKEESPTKSAVEQLNKIKKEIQSGLTFDEAITLYNEDKNNPSGKLGWVEYEELPITIQKELFSLKTNTISDPLKTQLGTHLFHIIDKEENPIPEDLDINKEKENMKEQKKSATIDMIISSKLIESPLKINNARIKAFDSKSKYDFESAAIQYQDLISNSPSDPIPHLLLARTYQSAALYGKNSKEEQKKLEKKAYKEFQKALIIDEASPESDNPFISLRMGEFQLQLKNKKDALTQFKKTFENGQENPTILYTLQKNLSSLNSKTFTKKVSDKIKEFEEKEKLKQEKES